MAIIHYRPFFDIDAEIRTLQNEVNRMFGAVNPLDKATFIPAAELVETPENICLRFELPGVDKANLNVEVTPNSVRISGQRCAPSEEGALNQRSEFRYGSFERVVGLSQEVKHNETIADYSHGVLTLTLPKRIADHEVVHKVTF
jgi:HSP20 family protein